MVAHMVTHEVNKSDHITEECSYAVHHYKEISHIKKKIHGMGSYGLTLTD